MNISVRGKSLVVPPHECEPVIEVDASEVGERYSLGVGHIDVIGKGGLVSRFWIDVRVNPSTHRPELIVRTKVGSELQVQREKRVQGSFNITKSAT